MNQQIVAMYKTAALTVEEVNANLVDKIRYLINPPSFYPKMLVTPRHDFGYQNVGVPHVVVRTLKLERNRFGFGTVAFGKQADMLVAAMGPDGTLMTFWVESFAFERWNDLTHGVPFDERALQAKNKLDELTKAEEAANEKVGDAGIEPRDLAPGERVVDAEDHSFALASTAGVPLEMVGDAAPPAPVEAVPVPVAPVWGAPEPIQAPVEDVSNHAPIPAVPSPTPGPADATAPAPEKVAVVADPAGPGTPIDKL